MIIDRQCQIIDIERHTDNVFSICLNAPEIAEQSKPGHFVNLKITNEGFDPFLRRPFSIYQSIKGSGSLEFLYQVMGRGTEILSRKKPGDHLQLIGPLGNTFNIEGNYELAFLVAGGIGIAPMPFLSQALKDAGRKYAVIAGFRTQNDMVPQDWLNENNAEISTDDGSYGFHGHVTGLLHSILDGTISNVRIFGCGPTPMLANLHKVSAEFKFDCQVSVEENMACGVGICKGCPIRIKTDGSQQKNVYRLACTEGPIMNSYEIEWSKEF